MAGYSDTPLLKKLGYKPGQSVFVVNQPRWFKELLQSGGLLAANVLPAQWAHGFFKSVSELQEFLDDIDFDDVEVGLWVSWPKKASGIKTDLTEQAFRDYILPLGWVDIKVAAIDDTWSGLKFTRRRKA